MTDVDHPEDEDAQELLSALREGDEAALQVLFDRFAQQLARRIHRRLSPRVRRRVDVSDVLQETRLAAHQGLQGLNVDDVAGLRAWLLGIAEKKAIDCHRQHDGAARRSVRREHTKAARPVTSALPGRQDTPSQIAIGAETAAFVRMAADALSDDYREVIRLVQEEGLSMREAAVRMGRSYEATRKLYGRAFCRFKEVFDELRGADGE